MLLLNIGKYVEDECFGGVGWVVWEDSTQIFERKFVPQRKEHTFAKMKINMLKSTPVLKLRSLNA